MGQSSSQLEQPSQQPQQSQDITFSTMARPPTAGTTGSQALARDLERSIMDSSQDVQMPPSKKKRKKKSKLVEEDSVMPESQPAVTLTPNNTKPNEPGFTPPSRAPTMKWKEGEHPLEVARRDLHKWLKRKQMQEAVLENRAKWVKMPNDKWGIKFYKPGEAPAKEQTKEEALHLKLIKEEMEKCRHTLKITEEDLGNKDSGVSQKADLGLGNLGATGDPTAGAAGAANPSTKPRSKKRKRNEAHQDEHAVPAQQHHEQAEPEPESGNVEPAFTSKRAAKRARKAQAAAEALLKAEQYGEPPPAVEANEKRSRKKKKKQVQPNENEQRIREELAARAQIPTKTYHDVNVWLASQDNPASAVENNPVAAEGADNARKRKRVSQYESDDEEEYKPSAEAPTTESSAPATSSGPFTTQERAICDKVFEEVRRNHNLSESQLIALIQSWRTAGIFKAELEHALPSRSKDQIRKFAQRRWHGHERGPWTTEQDESLRDAHAKWPGQWTKISELVDRLAGDCKDRWVKHLQYGDDKASGPWSQAEESKLIEAVEECIETIKKEYSEDQAILNDRGRLESMISWRIVSDKVAGGRSAKRCREKWEKLKARQRKDDNIIINEIRSAMEEESETTKEIAKDREARKLLESLELGDYYDIFVEVHSAFKDHSVQFHDEKNVLWSIVATKNPASRFNTTWAGGALRRLAIEKALVSWPVKSKKIQRKLEQAQTIPAKALQLAKLVEKRVEDATTDLPRTFKPELIGKTAEEMHEMKMAGKKKRSEKKAKKSLSKDYISESEDDDEDVSGMESTRTRSKIKVRVEQTDADANDDKQSQQQEVPESSEDELASPARDIRREPSQPLGDDNETHELESNATREVPAVQFEQPKTERSRPPGLPNREGDIRPSSFSRIGKESLATSPSLSPKAFLQRCKSAGKEQHEQYVKNNGR